MDVIELKPTGAPGLLIEVEPVKISKIAAAGALEGSTEGRAEDALEKLKDIGGSIAIVCESVRESVFTTMEKAKPDEFVIEFGVKVAGEGSAIISKISGEATLKVTATWKLAEGAEQEAGEG